LSFSAVGSSGATAGDAGRRHREVIAEILENKTARDI
jgi:hypothetical protein